MSDTGTHHARAWNSPAAGVPAGGLPVYTCPMHPEVRQDHPGACPKCGMTLDLVTPTANSAPAVAAEASPAVGTPAPGHPVYTCPMHPEVRQDHPGVCPKCGMVLELETPTANTNQAETAEFRDRTQRFWIGTAPIAGEGEYRPHIYSHFSACRPVRK